MPKKLPKHITRLLFLLIFFILLALAAKTYLTDPSFYKYGHYRADAIPELAAGEPLYRGSAYCLECHEQRKADWSNGAHVVVQCEVCHGINREVCLNPGQVHLENAQTAIPADTIRLCTTCHLAMPARPARQPQIELGQHPFSDEETPQCYTCHDPHSPSNEEPPAAAGTEVAELAAELPAAVAKCAKCHGKQGQGRNKTPPLAGMESAVFIEQMMQFKSGAVESKKMAKYAKRLSDEEIVELALYYEGLAAVAPATPAE